MKRGTRNKKRIYMDYAAATPLDPRVLRKMMPFFETEFGNPSSLHSEGRFAKEAIETARKDIARVLSVSSDEIIFTGSSTESIALALQGTARMYPKSHLVTTSLEHPAALENMQALRKNGHPFTMVEAEQNGLLDLKKLASAIEKNTILVSVVYVNSEVGSIQQISYIARIIRKEQQRRTKAQEYIPLYFHTDACQAAEYLSLSVPRLGVDLMTLNASKIYGPKGIAALYKRRGVPLASLWRGGGQEQGLRSGTEYVAGIIGFAKALQIAEKRKQKEFVRISRLQNYFAAELKRLVPQAVLQGPPVGTLRIPNNVNVITPRISSEILVLYLDQQGVAVSSGSACASNRQNSKAAHKQEGVRFTMGRHTTRASVDYAIKTLRDNIKILR